MQTVVNLFSIMEKKKNFTIDPVKGQIILILRKVEMNELVEKEVEIKLNEEEKAMESKIEEFGGEIKHLEFP